MHSSFARGVVLSLLLVVSLFTVVSLNEIDAQEKVVSAKSIGFEETTIIEFENNGKSEIQTFRIWLGKDISFKSFKTEKGWTGKKTPQGVIVFTTSDPIKPGQSVKFGVKTDKSEPGINWKAIDENENELQIGKTLVSESPSKPQIKDDKLTTSEGTGVLSDSIFRLIPEKPNVGATIRVTGEKFASNHELGLYLGEKFLQSFETNEDGHFMFTTKLPETQIADRVNFVVKDKQGNEKTISLRIGKAEARMAEKDVRLTISGLPSTINPGDVLLITGTGKPGGTVAGKVTDSEGNVLREIPISVNPQGKWSHETIVPLDATLGKYTVEIKQGSDIIQKFVTVASSKTIHITPSKIKYDPGEILSFNGTALSNQKIEIILENPQGTEIFSDIIQSKSDGFFEFEFPTEQSSVEGTYTLIAFQGENSEIVLVGLGQLPKVPIVVKMDKLNYKAGETAIMSLVSEASTTVSLLIIDPSDKPKFDDTITVGPDGKRDYELDLTDYVSGVYTAVVTRGNAQDEDVFSVGLEVGSGTIEISTTKETYKPGDPILVLGNSGPNILVTLTLFDPDGDEVRVRETFTNKEGTLSEGSFRVPSDAKFGTWKIKATSGPNFAEHNFSVTPSKEEGMSIEVTNVEASFQGTLVTINGYGGAVSQTIVIEITSSEGKLIDSLSFSSTGTGDFSTIWLVPSETPPGEYTIKASDSFGSAETIFILE